MAQKKAAFQLSLGFIIAVVFAIVLLSLALTWLRGMIGNIMGITDDLTQEAQSTLRKGFRETAQNFAVWPNEYKLTPGKGLVMSAGIENDAIDGKNHNYVVNVIPVSADGNILSINKCSSFSQCTSLIDTMESWTTYSKKPLTVEISTVHFMRIEVRPSGNAVKGTYLFNIVACYDNVPGSTLSSANCIETSKNIWGGSAQQLLINVI